MKLAIDTQVHENYGSAEKPYWKAKGGDVYVVEDLTVEQCIKIGKTGLPTLTKLIEQDDEYTRVEIIDWAILDDSEIECEDWETPILLKYDRVAECWMATRTTQADSNWVEGVDYSIEGWVLAEGGERKYYNNTYYGWNADRYNGAAA